MRNVREPTYSFVILTLILIVINVILARISVSGPLQSYTGVSSFYIAVAFMIVFGLWFGGYGVVAAYLGTLIGSGLLAGGTPQMPPDVALYWALAGLFQVLIPLVVFRALDVNVGIESKRDLFQLILFGVIINNIVGAFWGAGTLALGGVIKSTEFGGVFWTWLVGNIIVTIILVPILLRLFTPGISRSKLFVRNYWD
jgi:hypothetical protein